MLSSTTSYATGAGTFAALATGATRTYRVAYDVDAPDSAQSASQTFSLRWEAQSTTPTSMLVFGSNAAGKVGIGNVTDPVPAPASQNADPRWISIAQAQEHGCAVRADRTLWCWGDDALGATGTNDARTTITAPEQVATGIRLYQGGGFSSAALTWTGS